ncbi:hypothetical protein E2320_013952, partial [Naja naja]
MSGYEARHRSDLSEEADLGCKNQKLRHKLPREVLETSLHSLRRCMGTHLVHLSHNGVHHLTLEGTEDDRFVFDGVKDKAASRLNHARPDVPPSFPEIGALVPSFLLAGAGPFHLGEKLLLHGVEKVGPEVTRVQEDFMLQGDLNTKIHREKATVAMKDSSAPMFRLPISPPNSRQPTRDTAPSDAAYNNPT